MSTELASEYQWLSDRIETETGLVVPPEFEEHRETVRLRFSETLSFRPEWKSYNSDGSLAVHFSLNALPEAEKEHHVSRVIAKLKSLPS